MFAIVAVFIGMVLSLLLLSNIYAVFYLSLVRGTIELRESGSEEAGLYNHPRNPSGRVSPTWLK